MDLGGNLLISYPLIQVFLYLFSIGFIHITAPPPLPKTSIKSRFFISFVSNILRGGLSFATGLIIARGLGPSNYGDFVFLLGSFAAIRQLLDLGTSSAFFTFLSNKPRDLKFIISYALWQLFQFLFPLLLIGLILPNDIINSIWLGKERSLILLSFASVFLKEQAWNTLVQIGESNRLTHQVQTWSILIATIHLALIAGIWKFNLFSVEFLFSLIILEYLIATAAAFKSLYIYHPEAKESHWQEMFNDYRAFCTPLIFSSFVGFLGMFADRWLLQNFGGSHEQGFFGVGHQFAAISLIATMSMYNIFWKEIAEAHENQNLERVHFLFKKVCRFLYMAGGFISCYLVYWTEDIVKFTLGSSYLGGTQAVIIMFFYPIHQCLGQIIAAMFLAFKNTKTLMLFYMLTTVTGIIVSYFLMAPKDAWIPGLNTGSTGLALKTVILQIVFANIGIWWIDRTHGWKFDWSYQVIGLATTLILSYFAFAITNEISNLISINLFWKLGLHLIIYILFLGSFLWNFPGQAGLNRDEIRDYLSHFVRVFKR